MYMLLLLLLLLLFRYTMLVGRPPFETSSLNDTYRKIKRNEYHIPSRISNDARVLITKLLRPNPMTRPTSHEILLDPFFINGFRPERLPQRSVLLKNPLYVYCDCLIALLFYPTLFFYTLYAVVTVLTSDHL